MSKLYTSRSSALRARNTYGGWVIYGGEGEEAGRLVTYWWWTDSEGSAVDLTLPLVKESREAAESVVRHPLLTQDSGSPSITPRLCAKLA